MKILTLLLMLPVFVLGQKLELERTDSIDIGTSKFPIYMLKVGNYSASDPAKVFVVRGRTFDTLKLQIAKFYFSRKQEYNEYYILGVADMLQPEVETQGLIEFLKQIDSSRVVRHRSTFLREYEWDNVNGKIIYKSTFKDLKQIDNLHYLESAKQICKFMNCPSRQ